ncbi:hypothetical protein [Anaerobiospirillum thomasii]|uniref:Uncharacterized protein n=1 Tax=Anaerobiospirillum thomasii TaxID=179995 RepID=A0A2X0V6U9_9GAMM|nr:hypothetical protein [Anaerobiospirillum thomasii]SPT70079.1 Uncharacterised protein [Anaerobiospirillum thomasii]
MSAKERINMLIDVIKSLLTLLITALFAVIGYAVINYKTFDFYQSLMVGLGVFLLLFSVILFVYVIIKYINKLEDL